MAKGRPCRKCGKWTYRSRNKAGRCAECYRELEDARDGFYRNLPEEDERSYYREQEGDAM